MRISIQEITGKEEDEIIIKCHVVDDSILQLIHQVKSASNAIIGMDGDKLHKLSLNDILYFETVDNKSFLYCKENVYETKLRLYEFEEMTIGTHFFRGSKSTVLNSDRIEFIKPALSGRFEVSMENGEKVMVSRQFVPDLKRKLGVGG